MTIILYILLSMRINVTQFSRDIIRLCWRVLTCHAFAIVCMYIDIDIVYSACVRAVLARAVGSVCCWSAFLLVLLVSCCTMRALLSVVIWCTRVTMRCNRFSVLGSVSFTSCVLVRLWRILQAFTMCLADGVTVCACYCLLMA